MPAASICTPTRMPMPFVTRRQLVALALISLVAITLAAWLAKPSADARAAAAKQADAAIPVTAAVVGTMNLPVYLTGVGSVTPQYDVTVRSQVDGQITSVRFREGQHVHAGDVLIEIDRRALQAAADQAAAKLEQDKATLANARLELERHQRLAEVNAAPKQMLDTWKARVDELRAQIRGDQAAVQNARVAVDYTTIRAPISGRVGFRLVDQGNLVKANDTALLTLVTTSPITAIYSQSQDALPAIQAALRRGAVEAVALSTDGAAVLSHGRLSTIENRVDPGSGVVRMKAVFENADGALWPGQSVMIRTVVDVLRNATAVPEDAIQIGPDGSFVYVIVAGDKVAVRPVQVSHRVHGYAAVANGLRAGERVVVQGQYRLQDGARVAATMMPARDDDAGATGDGARAAGREAAAAAATDAHRS
ncbi:efflux RND transporter periplasmic adaptor subunit [Burkholderia thailandensis]|nr:efflux RND transporter periplasmic adaptor subunit [Burkholderia thailandensis]MDD1490384.1 efflux RND transporter periplasmic adaptor subunit [Burkholderia thailandensis]MDD1496444.1 efflux RND transporter periplasmic adaptor subunit [Burkholderia thailandensis]PJO69170.1 efflux RND transporter periplasmic adaptor subunit [Burkholderia thailandensis]TBW55786.1 efflux RND transporter periplasmic adaptor subunit [Burkholderia thailandensis]